MQAPKKQSNANFYLNHQRNPSLLNNGYLFQERYHRDKWDKRKDQEKRNKKPLPKEISDTFAKNERKLIGNKDKSNKKEPSQTTKAYRPLQRPLLARPRPTWYKLKSQNYDDPYFIEEKENVQYDFHPTTEQSIIRNPFSVLMNPLKSVFSPVNDWFSNTKKSNNRRRPLLPVPPKHIPRRRNDISQIYGDIRESIPKAPKHIPRRKSSHPMSSLPFPRSPPRHLPKKRVPLNQSHRLHQPYVPPPGNFPMSRILSKNSPNMKKNNFGVVQQDNINSKHIPKHLRAYLRQNLPKASSKGDDRSSLIGVTIPQLQDYEKKQRDRRPIHLTSNPLKIMNTKVLLPTLKPAINMYDGVPIKMQGPKSEYELEDLRDRYLSLLAEQDSEENLYQDNPYSRFFETHATMSFQNENLKGKRKANSRISSRQRYTYEFESINYRLILKIDSAFSGTQ